MTPPQISLGLFAVAAVGGLTLAVQHARAKPAPLGIAVAHGGVGAVALALLAYAVLAEGVGGLAKPALGVLVVAALGGFFLLSFRLRSKPMPLGIIGVHALVAVTGVGLLAASVFSP